MSVLPNAVRYPSRDAEGSAVRAGSRVDVRRERARQEILAAAWTLVAEKGLAALTMRELGPQVGMRPQSLYSYFSSKADVYDAIFAQGYVDFTLVMQRVGEVDPVTTEQLRSQALTHAYAFFDFCVADAARFQLLFLRTIPGFTPSETSWAAAQHVYDVQLGQLARFGVNQSGLDLWTAVLTGLASQQIANEPGGTRWRNLVSPAVDLLLSNTVNELDS